MDLPDFLLARIAEDDAAARDELDGWDLTYLEYLPNDYDMRFSPPRILAECEAKRRIVEHQQRAMSGSDYMPPLETTWILRTLALPYTDHPDYREEWRP